MPLKKRNIGASLQSGTNGASQSSDVESPPAGRQKKQRRDNTRYGFRKELNVSPSPPAPDKAAKIEVQTGVVIVDHVVREVQPFKVGQHDDEPEAKWHLTFHFQDRVLMKIPSIRAPPSQLLSCIVSPRLSTWKSMPKPPLFNCGMRLSRTSENKFPSFFNFCLFFISFYVLIISLLVGRLEIYGSG